MLLDAWLDLCYGAGRALLQAAELCRAAGFGHRVKLTGIDLVPIFEAIPPGLGDPYLVPASAETWSTTEQYDLITGVHGLHYVGD